MVVSAKLFEMLLSGLVLGYGSEKKFFAINYWLFRTGYIRRLGNTAIISFFPQLLFCAKQRYKSFCEGALFSGINIFTAILAKLQGMMNKVFFS